MDELELDLMFGLSGGQIMGKRWKSEAGFLVDFVQRLREVGQY